MAAIVDSIEPLLQPRTFEEVERVTSPAIISVAPVLIVEF